MKSWSRVVSSMNLSKEKITMMNHDDGIGILMYFDESIDRPGRSPNRAAKLSTDHQISSTQPMTRRVKTVPLTAWQRKWNRHRLTSQVVQHRRWELQNSPFNRTPALRPSYARNRQTPSQEGCTDSHAKACHSLFALFLGMAGIEKKSDKREQHDQWFTFTGFESDSRRSKRKGSAKTCFGKPLLPAVANSLSKGDAQPSFRPSHHVQETTKSKDSDRSTHTKWHLKNISLPGLFSKHRQAGSQPVQSERGFRVLWQWTFQALDPSTPLRENLPNTANTVNTESAATLSYPNMYPSFLDREGPWPCGSSKRPAQAPNARERAPPPDWPILHDDFSSPAELSDTTSFPWLRAVLAPAQIKIRSKKQLDPFIKERSKRGTLRLAQGSVVRAQQNSTRLAELWTRSLGSQTSLEVDTPTVGPRHQSRLQILEPCSSGAPLMERIGWNHSSCSTALTSSSRTFVRKNQVQQNVSQRTISKAHRTESHPSRATWTSWTAAALQKPQWASRQQARPWNLLKRELAQPRQTSWSRRPLRPFDAASCARASRNTDRDKAYKKRQRSTKRPRCAARNHEGAVSTWPGSDWRADSRPVTQLGWYRLQKEAHRLSTSVSILYPDTSAATHLSLVPCSQTRCARAVFPHCFVLF